MVALHLGLLSLEPRPGLGLNASLIDGTGTDCITGVVISLESLVSLITLNSSLSAAKYKERLVVQLEERDTELSSMSEELDREKKRLRDLWRINCEQITQYDVECGLKDAES